MSKPYSEVADGKPVTLRRVCLGVAAVSKVDVWCPRVGLTTCSPVRSPIKGEGCSSIRRRFNALD
jgi:hypothetical protein